MGAVKFDDTELEKRLRWWEHQGVSLGSDPAPELGNLPPNFDDVVHELSHYVVMPHPNIILKSSKLNDFILSFPPPIAQRMELASWLVERRVAIDFGGSCTLHSAVLHAISAIEGEYKRVPKRQAIFKTARRWVRQTWVKDCAWEVVWALNHRELPCPRAPSHVLESW